MIKTYLFYDIETTGLNPCFDQIIQFAAIRTDEQLNELKRHDLTVRLNPDVLPSPGALITHGMGVDKLTSGKMEMNAISFIHQLLNQPQTHSLGYNTLGFDDEFLRFSFYRNLLPPYTHQYDNDCGRLDIYPMVVMYYLFKREVLKWPQCDDKLSLKLESFNELYRWVDGASHNALNDVEVTIALAKQLFQDRDMWDYLCGYFDKVTVMSRLRQLECVIKSTKHNHQQALYIEPRLGEAQQFQLPVLGLGWHQHYKNQSLWLRLDDPDLPEQSIEDMWIVRKKTTEPGFLLPYKERFLKALSSERSDIVKQNLAWLCDHLKHLEDITEHYQTYQYPKIENIDLSAALYQKGFASKADVHCQAEFHIASTEDKASILDVFQDKDLRHLGVRMLGRCAPESLSEGDRCAFEAYVAEVFGDGEHRPRDHHGHPRLTVAHVKDEIATLLNSEKLTEPQRDILITYQKWLEKMPIEALS